MTPEVLDKFLSQARLRADIDIEEYAASLPVGKHAHKDKANNKKQAIRRKRAGLQWFAMLKLAANCGLDNVDLCRIQWDNIITDGKMPHMNFARRKTERKTGVGGIDRKTPLLPSTIAALNAWRDYNKESRYPNVFTNDAKSPFVSSKISEGFNRLREDLKDCAEWSFKNIRNIGATVGRRNHRHSDEREAFLGHAVGGMSAYYEDNVDESYLLPLVNLIAAEYFSGETVKVTTPPKKKK